jgi:hypothetical protein
LKGFPDICGDLVMMFPKNKEWLLFQDLRPSLNFPCGKSTPSFPCGGFNSKVALLGA